jgi:hypothetical protein
VQIWIGWHTHARGIDRKETRHSLFILIAQQQVGNRPGRIEPRAVKRRPKPYPLLTQSRATARAKVRK